MRLADTPSWTAFKNILKNYDETMNSRNLSRWLHTVRHLRPIQIANRIQRRFRSAKPSLSDPPSARPKLLGWTPPIEREPSLLEAQIQRVFEQDIPLAPKAWNDPNLSHLTRYNLHYFDDLNAAGFSERTLWHIDLIARWIQENPPGIGTGWEPYPLSIRIANWIKWSLAGHALTEDAKRSLAFQVRSLENQLEFHLLGNHLWANAKALIFAGCYFEGPEAARWLQRGTALFDQELKEQILPDGGHFELSPMYHSVMLEDLLDLVNLYQITGKDPEPLLNPIESMRRWLLAMCHPDGGISFFNDAAFGIVPTAEQLADYASRLQLPEVQLPQDRVIHLKDSGYIRVQFPKHTLLIDVAEVGPSYVPGHAHADTLCFEWSFGGERVFVNSGTSCYGTSAERLRQRGTAAHNTVIVDDTNSSDVWSGFRVGQKAHPFDLKIQTSAEDVKITCSHSGYQRLAGRVTHTRRWQVHQNGFSIRDELSGRHDTAEARFHFHPAWNFRKTPEGYEALGNTGGIFLHLGTHQPSELKSSSFHPRFEVTLPNQVLRVPIDGSELLTEVNWQGKDS